MDLATQIVGGLGAIALAAVGFIVHSIRNDIISLKETQEKIEDNIATSGDRLQAEINRLSTKVEILIDRDRRKRIQDYGKDTNQS